MLNQVDILIFFLKKLHHKYISYNRYETYIKQPEEQQTNLKQPKENTLNATKS